MLVWLSVWSEVQIVCIWSSWRHCHPKTPSSLASYKSRLVLPFWYRLTQVVLEKRPLNGCSSIVTSERTTITSINQTNNKPQQLYDTAWQGPLQFSASSYSFLPNCDQDHTENKQLQLKPQSYTVYTMRTNRPKWTQCTVKKVKVARTRLPSVGFQSWSRFLAVSLQVTWVINTTVGCHYFPPGLQLP